jgi:hypothetical protein
MGSHPHLITAVPYKENGVEKGDPRFTLSMVFDTTDLAKFQAEDATGNIVEVDDIRKLAVALAREQFPELLDAKAFKGAFYKGDDTPTKGWPFVAGDKTAADMETKGKDGFERFKGKIVIAAKTYEKSPPILTYPVVEGGKTKWKTLQRGSDVDMKKAQDLFQGGNMFRAELSMRASIVSDAYYISFYINAVRFLAVGEPFGRKGLMERFDGINGGESDHNPMANADDEIPF